MKFRSFIIAYGLVLALLLFADRRTSPKQDNHYSHVVDLTASEAPDKSPATRIISPAALIPGTWSAGQIPAERLIAPLVVIDQKSSDQPSQIALDDIANWEERHGVIPQGAVVAIRRASSTADRALASDQPSESDRGIRPTVSPTGLPITAEAAQFLMDARYVLGFAVESRTNLKVDRTLARQLALHGSYVVDGASGLASLPTTGSLVIVAPVKTKSVTEAPVRILAMVR